MESLKRRTLKVPPRVLNFALAGLYTLPTNIFPNI